MPRFCLQGREEDASSHVRIASSRFCTPERILLVVDAAQEAPKVLYRMRDNSAIFWDDESGSWSEELGDTELYCVPMPSAATQGEGKSNQGPTVSADDLLHAALCSHAVYEDDERAMKTFLNANLSSHCIDSISVAVHGSLRYLLAVTSPKLSGENKSAQGKKVRGKKGQDMASCVTARTLIVAFRGTVDRADIKADMKHLGAMTSEGQVHSGFMERASLLPLLPFINLLKPTEERGVDRILLTGHSMGGAVSQLVFLRLIRECLLFHTDVDVDLISSVSFASPLVATRDVALADANLAHCQRRLVNILDHRDAGALLVHSEMSLARVLSSLQNGLTDERARLLVGGSRSLLSFVSFGPAADAVLGFGMDALNVYIKEVLHKYYPLGVFGFIGPGQEGEIQYVADGDSVTEIIAGEKSLDREHHRMQHYWDAMQRLWSKRVRHGQCHRAVGMVLADNEGLGDSMRAANRKIPRRVRSEPLFVLDRSSLEVMVGMHSDKHVCRLTIQGRGLDFFIPQLLRAQGLPIVKKKETGHWEEEELQVQLDSPVTSQLVELACELDSQQVVGHHPVIIIHTHFDSVRVTIDKKLVKDIVSLTEADRTVNRTSYVLFVRAFQRGMAELLSTPLHMRRAVAGTQPLLAGLIQLEGLILGSDSDELQRVVQQNLSGQLEDLDRIAKSKQVAAVLQAMTDYFHSPLEVVYTNSNVKKYILYGITGVIAVAAISTVPSLAGPILTKVASGLSVGKLAVGITSTISGLGIGIMGLKYTNARRQGNVDDELINIVALRRILDALPAIGDDGESLSSPFVEKDSLMLEKALETKLTALGHIDKSITQLVNDDVFLSTPEFPTATLTADSMRSVVVRMMASVVLYRVRKNLAHQFFLGIVGPQNSGKSTLTSILLGGRLAIPTGDDVHTEHACLYTVSSKFKVVDFAGMTATSDEIANVANRCGFMASAFVYVTHFLGDPERVDMGLLQQLAPFGCRVLFCLNQCARREDSLRTVEDVEMYRTRWLEYIENELEAARDSQQDELMTEADACEAEPGDSLPAMVVDVILTDFSHNSNRLKSIGVKDVNAVQEWVQHHLASLGLADDESAKFLRQSSARL